MRPRAGIDLDGVVHQWSPNARRLLKARFGVDVGESLSWDWIKDHTTRAQWSWLWTTGIRKGLFMGEPYAGAISALARIATRYDIVVITKRPDAAIVDTYRWLAKHRILASEVHILSSTRSKTSVPRCDWYVDDNLDNVHELAEAGERVYLFDQPWNQSPTHHRSVRIKGWEQLLGRVML